MSEIKWPHHPQPRHIPDIAEAHGRIWELHAHPPGHFAVMDYWPVVTISYEHGIPGDALGRNLAERIHFDAWDEERVTRIARRIDRETDQATPTDLDGGTVTNDYFFPVWRRREKSATEQPDPTQRILQSLARRGSTVLAGHGIRHLLDPSPAVHVRLVAHLEKRIQWLATRNQMSIQSAKDLLTSEDKQEAAWMREGLDRKSDAPPAYDVVLSLDAFDPERTVGLMLMAYLAKFGKLPTPSMHPHVALISSIVYLQPPIGGDVNGAG